MTTDVRLASFALSLYPTSDVLCAYAAPLTQYFGDRFERWICFGTFTVPLELRGRFGVIGFRTPGVTAQCAIYGPELVEGSEVQITSDYDAMAESAVIVLSPGRVYRMVARAISVPGDANYMVIRTASMFPPEVI